MKKGVRVAVIVVVVVAVVGVAGYFGYSRLSGREGEGPPLGFLALGSRASAAEGSSEEEFSVPVAVTPARRQDVREILTLYGSVFAEKEVSILTTVSGKVSQIRVDEGDFVEKDEVLAVIDRDQAGLKFAPVEVDSTIAGVVKSVLTQEGATANPSAPLFQIVDMDVVEVVVDVPEKRIGQVSIGQPAEVSVVSYPDRVFHGTIDRLSPVVSPASRTMETRIRVVNHGFQLKPGMFAEARIILQRRSGAVTIPLAALVDRGGEQVAFVVEAEVAREVRPEIAFLYGERAVVDSGIQEADLLVVVGQQSLNGGDAVSIAEVRE